MNEHKSFILKVLEWYRGDNLDRAELFFKGMTEDQMQQEYGQSGKTRAEILAGWTKHNNQIDDAIEWFLEKDNLNEH